MPATSRPRRVLSSFKKTGSRMASMIHHKPTPIFKRRITRRTLKELEYNKKTGYYKLIFTLKRIEFQVVAKGLSKRINPNTVRINGELVAPSEAEVHLAVLFKDLWDEQHTIR